MGRRSAWAAGVAGAAVLLLVVVAAVLRPWSGDQATILPPTSSPEPLPAVLPAAGGHPPPPTATGVHEALDQLVGDADSGGRLGVAVTDVVTGEQLYGHDAETPLVPASTIKLVTAATVLAARGPAYQLPTVVFAGEEPGEVVLAGGGDPTLAVAQEGFYPGAARLDELAEQVRHSRGGAPVESVTVDDSLFTGSVHGPWEEHIADSGFVGPITAVMTDGGRVDPDPEQGQQASARHGDPALAAGEAFAELLGLSEDAVSRGALPEGVSLPDQPAATPATTVAPGTEATPAASADAEPGAELGRVLSPPLLRLVEIMLAESDNVLAEALARQVALARGEPASFQGAAAAMSAVLAELGVEQGGNVIADGSGLSRDNQLSAAILTELLGVAAAGLGTAEADIAIETAPEEREADEREADETETGETGTGTAAEPGHPAVAGMFAGLPVAGWSGTLTDRYREQGANGTVADGAASLGPGAGVVRAKTGSLTGVNTLAGLVVTADGRLLAFALLSEDSGVSGAALDEIAGALAGCGCR